MMPRGSLFSKSPFLGRYGFRISHGGDLVIDQCHFGKRKASKHRPTVARVDLDAIAFNVQQVSEHTRVKLEICSRQGQRLWS